MNNPDSPSMITVLIPTYNRDASLEETLGNLWVQQVTGEFTYEIIVIDNNSTDTTKATVDRNVPRFGSKLRYLFEPKQGKTFALNLGIRNSLGSIITCIDDDCLFEKDFLLKMFKIFKEAPADVGFIGGKILPHWLEKPYPAWLEEFLPDQPLRSTNSDGLVQFFCGPLGILDYGNTPYIVDYAQTGYDRKYFYGANTTFRKSVLDKFGYFNERSILVEDTEMCIRLLNAGVKARYSPELKVFHKIKASAINTRFFYRYNFNKGRRREIVESYPARFYHPFGIQMSYAHRTLHLFWKSFFTNTFKQKLYLRCQVLFNTGQMIKIFKDNIL